MRDFFEDYIWKILLFIVCIWVMGMITYPFCSKKHINYYYLGDSKYESSLDGIHYRIKADIENFPDQDIILDKSITAQEAVRLVDSLNATLPKK